MADERTLEKYVVLYAVCACGAKLDVGDADLHPLVARCAQAIVIAKDIRFICRECGKDMRLISVMREKKIVETKL